jgi:hypothetical protein
MYYLSSQLQNVLVENMVENFGVGSPDLKNNQNAI